MKKSTNTFRWIGVAIFGIMAISSLGSGGFLSVLLFLLGGIIIAPLDFVQKMRGKIKLNKTLTIVLAVILLFAGTSAMPTSEVSTDNTDSSEISGTVSDDASKETNSKTETTSSKEQNNADNEYFKTNGDANGKQANISTELLDTLVDKGYTIEHASEIAEILNTVGIESIKIENMTGTPEKGLNAVICYPNGYTTRDRRFYFTTEDGILFIAKFTSETLYDVEQGGFLKSYGDVHVPEKSIDMNTYTTLQGLAETEVKKYLNHPSSASFGMLDWKIGRSDDNYKIMGCVSASNSFGVKDDLQFSVWFLKTSTGFSIEAVVIDGQQVK